MLKVRKNKKQKEVTISNVPLVVPQEKPKLNDDFFQVTTGMN